MEYTELFCRTNFSFLKGGSHAHELVQRALDVGLKGLALTDTNGVYALPRALESLPCDGGVRLISGCELLLDEGRSLRLLAKDRDGYGLMSEMITKAHAGKPKGQGYLTLDEFVMLSQLPSARGLIVMVDAPLEKDLSVYRDLYGDRLYLALARYLDGLDDERTYRARQLSRRFSLGIVAVNDVHYHLPERRRLQDVLTCIREGVDLRSAGFRLFGNEERYLKSPQQMASLFSDLREALRATMEIHDQCQFSLRELRYRYPSEWIPKTHTAQSYLEFLVWQGAMDRYGGRIPIEVEKQILREFQLCAELGYADYFLTVYDIVAYAKTKNIYCQGRGSAANSVLCYCLGITVVDPVKMNLLFERFLSKDRGEPPDIDVDFEHDRREEVIQYIYEKYGRDRAAMVAAVRTYRRRSSFLEVSKAFGVDVGTRTALDLENHFESIAGPLVEKREKIESMVSELKGFPRHLSIHSCGFTLSADSLSRIVPIEPARMEGRTIVQWDKNDLDTLGLVKIDVLALGFLSVIHKACDLLGIHFSEIPQHDDPKVYEMIQRADTIGTFQIESRAQIATLGVTRPECFYDLVVEVALIRPGPHVGHMKKPYISRRDAARRGQLYVMDDPVLQKILGRTYGVPLFQEQVMRLAVEKAGFSSGEADQLRRSIAAWRSAGSVDELSLRFYQGLLDGGMSEALAQELFGYMKGFSAYGFPESHAVSFAILSYLSAWLKCYHPAELLVGLLNAQPMGFYPVDVLISDARRHGVRVLPVCIEVSQWESFLESSGAVRLGFSFLKGLPRRDFDQVLQERQRRPFLNLQDFLMRTSLSRQVLRTMAMADVFACFGLDQRHSFWESLQWRHLMADRHSLQMTLFATSEDEPVSPRAYSPSHVGVFAPMTLLEGILEDHRSLGFSLRGHLMTAFRQQKTDLPQLKSSQVKALSGGTLVCFAGVVLVLQRPPTAQGAAFMTLEDEEGSVDVTLSAEVYENFAVLLRSTRFIIVSGVLSRRAASVSLVAKTLESFSVVSPVLAAGGGGIQPGAHPRAQSLDLG